jgi:uncharacterized protein YecT (DUF1311 family)
MRHLRAGGMIALSLATALVTALAPQVAIPAREAADCAEPLTQAAMNICAVQDYARADAELNRVWRELRIVAKCADEHTRADGRPGHWASLLEAQRAWLGYRDAHCRLVGYDARGGSLEPMLVSGCKTELTRARTQRMRELLTNQVSGEAKAGAEK